MKKLTETKMLPGPKLQRITWQKTYLKRGTKAWVLWGICVGFFFFYILLLLLLLFEMLSYRREER